MWRSLGFYSNGADGQFCIHGVTGPDEYNTVVNNNAFTNLMARENLRAAARTLEQMRDSHPERFAQLAHVTSLNDTEIAEWRAAADRMCVPFDETAGIHLQDDEFLRKIPWDFENTPPDRYPLLLHFHPLVIYRHNVIKQADIVLAMFLLTNEFSLEQKRRNFDYYDPLTTGDSSLSVSVQSILAMELGYRDKAIEYPAVRPLDGPGRRACQRRTGLSRRFDGWDLDGGRLRRCRHARTERPHHLPSAPRTTRRRTTLSSHDSGPAPDGGYRRTQRPDHLSPAGGTRTSRSDTWTKKN